MRRSYFALMAVAALACAPGLMSQSAKNTAGESIAPAAMPDGCAGFADADSAGTNQKTPVDFNPANLDRSVSPCTDFFRFADGGWIKDHPIPAQYAAWGTFEILNDKNEQHLREILDKAAADKAAKKDPNWQKIGDYYASCMNVGAIDKAGLTPLDTELQRIAAVHDAASLQAEVARLQGEGLSVMFDFGSTQDFKDSTKEIAAVRQAGLGLPDRQYYLKEDAKSKALRAEYLRHVTNMFQLMGDSEATAAAEAKTVMSVETALAKASMDRVDMRNPDNIYHKMPVKDLRTLGTNIAWPEYFREMDAPGFSDINVQQPNFFKALDASFAATPLASWKTYLRWHLIHSAAPALSAKFVEEDFNFYGKTLTGAKILRPRWQRCVASTDRQLGEALGQYYVKQYFPPEAKAKAIEMVKNLEGALKADLQTLDWMSPATRAEATKKLEQITLKIGYPDKWRDYSKYQVTRGSYVENVEHGRMFEAARDIAKIGKPVDRTEWGMTPPTVNAYYNPDMNEIVFPAGILQKPFFDPNGDPAINYGGIGAVIGHEMTHGFDDEGARFDGQGNLKNWWTPQDLKNFQARGDCVAHQFDGFVVEKGLHENGKLVEGESIADLGGLTISHAAFMKTLEGKTPEKIGGFTADQRFFLGFAQIWAGEYRPEAARLLAKTNEHPLPQFRTNGPLSNMPSFAAAWGCKAGSPMVRTQAKRCRIW